MESVLPSLLAVPQRSDSGYQACRASMFTGDAILTAQEAYTLITVSESVMSRGLRIMNDYELPIQELLPTLLSHSYLGLHQENNVTSWVRR